MNHSVSFTNADSTHVLNRNIGSKEEPIIVDEWDLISKESAYGREVLYVFFSVISNNIDLNVINSHTCESCIKA